MGAFEARFRTGATGADAGGFAALDIGADKIACLIARSDASADGTRPVDIAGVAAVPLRTTDDDARVHLSRVAIDQALRMAGDAWPAFGAAYGGPDLVSTLTEGAVRLRGPVGPRDVAAAIAAARAACPLAQRRLLHAAPLRYRIDDGEPVVDPRGIAGAELFVELCLTHAPADAVADIEAVLEDAGARPEFLVAAPFAAGCGVLTLEERTAGAIVIDLGAAGAGIAAFRHGGLQHAEWAPGGGQRLTRDLAARLHTSFAVAERAKRLHGELTGEGEPSEAIEIPVLGDDGRLEPGMALRGAFAEALEPRLEEIFTRIAQRLEAADLGVGDAAFGVALTGGVSQTPGLRQLAARVLGRPVRIAQPTGFSGFDETGAGGGFAVAAGLVRCGLERVSQPAPMRPPAINLTRETGAVKRRVGGALTWLKENF